MSSIALLALLARVPIKHSDEAEEFVPEKKLSPLEAARKAVRKGDMDGDWSLNELEFKTQMLRDAQFRSAVFAALDIDEDGLLDAEPFQNIGKTHKEAVAHSPTPLQVAHRAVREGDADGDRSLSGSEFNSGPASKDQSFLSVVFQALDRDGDGLLDAEPFEAIEERRTGKAKERPRAFGIDHDAILHMFDEDDNGKLSIDEFAEAYTEIIALPAKEPKRPLWQAKLYRAKVVSQLTDQLAVVRELRPLDQSPAVQQALWKAAGLNPVYKVSGAVTGEPSFTQLFSHSTWTAYTGVSPFRRWLRAVLTWRHSTVFASVLPLCLCFSVWAFAVASLPAAFRLKMSAVPLTLLGSAIGLVLVFRVNNLYGRLMEARGLWGRAVYLCRQAAQTVATALLFDETLPADKQPAAHEAAASVCRYLVACAWELNSKLTGKGDGPGKTRDLRPGEDTEILDALLPSAEAAWIAAFRSRPLALLGCMRRVLHAQLRAGTLDRMVYRKLDEDLKELDLVVGGCERLFSSPTPPTMARHGQRSMFVWLLGVPLVLAGTMAPAVVALWTFVVAYVFVGIEEVEQPFEIVPMTRICAVITLNIEESLALPPAAPGLAA